MARQEHQGGVAEPAAHDDVSDDEFIAAAKDFIKRQAAAGKPFFELWKNEDLCKAIEEKNYGAAFRSPLFDAVLEDRETVEAAVGGPDEEETRRIYNEFHALLVRVGKEQCRPAPRWPRPRAWATVTRSPRPAMPHKWRPR